MDAGIPISLLLLVISVIYYLFQPKKINLFYGYRTPKSVKNIENWKFSNRFAAIGMIVISLTNCIGLYLASLFVDLEKISQYYFLAFLVFEFILLFYITEKKMPSNEKK